MKFDELLQCAAERSVFTTGQILAGESRPADVRRQLDRWVRSGKVRQLRRGVYLLADAYAKRAVHPFVIANVLQRASYVSLQSALSYYGMIPEYVPVTTSVTTGRPEELLSPVGRFAFRHVCKRLFTGFTEVEVAPGQHALMATPYKALIDLLYLTPHSDREHYLRELRATPPDDFDRRRFSREAAASASAKVKRAVNLLIALWKEC